MRAARLGALPRLAASLMVAAFAARALITPGFMPADGQPLALEICPEGFPAQLLHHAGPQHHHHGGTHPGSDHCAFAGACTSGPLSQVPGLAAAALAVLAPSLPVVPAAHPVRVVYLPQARAPPTPV